MKRKLFLLFCWIIGMIFPVGGLTLFSKTYSDWFNWVFATQASHVIAHAGLFGVLAILLAAIFTPKGAFVQIGVQRKEVWRLALIGVIVSLVAALQEIIQLLYKARQSGADEAFDIGVDMIGALIGLLVFWSLGLLLRWSKSSYESEAP